MSAKRRLLALALALAAAPAAAQTDRPSYRPGASVTDTNPHPVQLRCWDGTNAVWTSCTLSGGGGGGGGDASAANQVTQTTRLTELRDRIGAATSPAAGSTNFILTSIQALLGGTLTVGTHAVDTVIKGTSADRGGIFGTTAAQLMAANASRRGFAVQVQGASGSCYISGQATATADYHSLQIVAGSYFESPGTFVGTGAISIVCTAASTSVYAREW